MNKPELAKSISDKTGSTVKDAEKFLDAYVETITESLSKGEDVSLIGFGTFSVGKRAARIARNFKTKETIKIPEAKTVKFRIGKKLKDSVK